MEKDFGTENDNERGRDTGGSSGGGRGRDRGGAPERGGAEPDPGRGAEDANRPPESRTDGGRTPPDFPRARERPRLHDRPRDPGGTADTIGAPGTPGTSDTTGAPDTPGLPDRPETPGLSEPSPPSGADPEGHALTASAGTAAPPGKTGHHRHHHHRKHVRAPRDVRVLRTVTVCLLLFVILLSALLLSGRLRRWLLPGEYDPDEHTLPPDTGRADADGTAAGVDTLSADTHRAPETAPPDEPQGEPDTARGTEPPETPGTEIPGTETAGDPEPESPPDTAPDTEPGGSGEEDTGADPPVTEEAAEPDTQPETDESEGTGGIWQGSALYSRGLAYQPTADGGVMVAGPGTCTDAHVIIPAYAPTGEPVTSIAPRAFYGMEQLTAVTIPASVTSIGQLAFSGCPGLAYITVDPDNPAYVSRGGVLFSADLSVLMIRPPARADDTLVIPRSVVCIDVMAFWNVRGLSTIWYEGSADDWQKLYIGVGNNALLACGVRFGDRAEPTGKGDG